MEKCPENAHVSLVNPPFSEYPNDSQTWQWKSNRNRNEVFKSQETLQEHHRDFTLKHAG